MAFSNYILSGVGVHNPSEIFSRKKMRDCIDTIFSAEKTLDKCAVCVCYFPDNDFFKYGTETEFRDIPNGEFSLLSNCTLNGVSDMFVYQVPFDKGCSDFNSFFETFYSDVSVKMKSVLGII